MDVPGTLLVTNDYPPRVGGIQRTLEALWKHLPPERVSVFCPDREGASDVRRCPALSDPAPARARPAPHTAGRRARRGRRGGGRRGGRALRCLLPVGRHRAEARGAGHAVPRCGARLRVLALADARLPQPDAVRHLESLAGPGHVQRLHRADGADGRARTGAGERALPRRRPDGLPARPRDRRPAAASRDRRAAARRMREPARRPQGPGHADQEHRRRAATGARRGADDRGRRAVRGDAARTRRGRTGGIGVLQRPGLGGGSSPLLRDGRRVRDALQDASGWVWRSRVGATSSSRPPPAPGRWWWGIRAARARRSWTARRASWWTAGARARWATRWPASSGTRILARRMGEAGRARVERAHTWPRIAETLALWLQMAAG